MQRIKVEFTNTHHVFPTRNRRQAYSVVVLVLLSKYQENSYLRKPDLYSENFQFPSDYYCSQLDLHKRLNIPPDENDSKIRSWSILVKHTWHSFGARQIRSLRESKRVLWDVL